MFGFAQQTAKPALFGQPATTNPPLFGGQPTTNPSPFGQTQQTSPFGQQQTQPTQFGQNTTQLGQQPQQTSPFGQQQPQQPSPFGQQQQPSPFGQQQQPSPFGQQQQPSPFGQPAQQITPFGQQPQQPQQPSPFGQPAQTVPFGQQPQSPFGGQLGQPQLIQPQQVQPQPQPLMQPGQVQVTPQQQISLQQITDVVDKINGFQNQTQFQNLVFLLTNIQAICKDSLTKATSQNVLFQKQSQQAMRSNSIQSIKARYLAIKARNQKLLIKLLNLRQKIVNQMYMHKVRSPTSELELDQLNERIRQLKMQVSNKFNQLRFLKLNKVTEGETMNSVNNFATIKLPLVDLRKGAEVLEKQTLKMRQQLQLVIRYVHGQNI